VTYGGSLLESFANAVAARAGHTIRLGEPDDAAISVEQAIIWTQPKVDRYRYAPPRYQPQSVVGASQAGDAMLDRFMRVEVLIRAPGSERRLLELSDGLLAALDYELGAEGAQGENWRIVGPSDGGGSGNHDAAWEERFVIELKYAVIRERFTEGAPLVVETRNDPAVEGSGLEVEGPAQGQDVEEVL
jgi:hypothetical protein